MFDFTSLLFPLILTWMLTFTDVQTFREETVRVGDEVTLKCENANDFSDGCYRIIWIYSQSTKSTFTLFENGKIHKDVGSKSDRLSLTEKCSLFIKKITDEDAGRYTCRQFNTSGHMETDFDLELTVINTNDVTSTPKPTFKPSSKTRAFKSTTTLKSSSSSANSRSTTASALLSSDTHTAATNLHFKTGVWWRIIYVPVGVAALSVITVSVWIWTRT
ncbi:uncharacterized protein LOC112159418 isoform X1 [Oryzias melastigma]|uniref:uncharacterized protein LOC112159418 isoform X1 n=1 Tax=Oryzias melastigma TaxID=30732 RepID=UPI000CF7F1ED|nr:uncharacterized protein LOC112159418 isoform X1 [Oryzias melastigma]